MKIKYNLQLNQVFEAKMQNQQFSKQNMLTLARFEAANDSLMSVDDLHTLQE